MKKFNLKFWSSIPYHQRNSQNPSYTEAFVTIQIAPSIWPKEGCPNGYLFTHNDSSYHIFVDSFKVVSEKSSHNWEDYFSINLQGANHLTISSSCGQGLFLNFPELILDIPESFHGYE